jgi:UDP-glucuronate decarboxylase
MKILVTGGGGFLGSHLCDRLLQNSRNIVYCLDNWHTGSKRNIKHLIGNNRFVLITSDVTEDLHISEADQIYNMACPASPRWYQEDGIRTLDTNVLGIRNVLEFASYNDNCRVLQASTSEVYGDPQVHPQQENYWGNVNPIGPRACYDEGKRIAETYCMEYFKEGQDVRIARIFNTYGPRMAINDGRAVSNFIIQAIRGKPITVYGSGKQTRSFCYVDDTVDGLIRLMNHEQEALYGDTCNIGNPTEVTLMELALLIKELASSNSEIIHDDCPEDDPQKRKPDIYRAQHWLDWQPTIDLEEGLFKTIEYFSQINMNSED